ncbi:MAG: hypothetical protein ICV68_08910 [Pyrinomonadaceae bacterium]|nr:hypothetical protein [Pyrinomonadaceae bacterium]
MSAHVSCPVFRCPKTSVAQCTGHRRACDRYYCQTHTKGTLCDRCANLKQEEMKAGYKEMLKSLERRAYSESVTAGIIALFSFSLLLLVSAIVCAYLQKSDRSYLPIFVISLGGAVLGLIGTLLWYLMKAHEYIRAESVELDLTHPGFYDYYQQWQQKIEQITDSTY